MDGDITMGDPAKFTEGQKVRKVNGYEFDSTVVSVFCKLDGQIRVVCESSVIPGLLHIFSENQLEPAEECGHTLALSSLSTIDFDKGVVYTPAGCALCGTTWVDESPLLPKSPKKKSRRGLRGWWK